METLSYNTASIAERLKDAYLTNHNAKNTIPHVLLLGVGTQGGGIGTLRFFMSLGWSITAFDERPKKIFADMIQTLTSAQIRWRFERLPKNEFATVDLVIKNPGIPLNHPLVKEAKKRQIPVTNDADIFLHIVPRERIIGITGTKGKTTTALLLAHTLASRYQTALVGIPQSSFFNIFPKYQFKRKNIISLPDFIVAEFSSFDLDLATASPHIALVTSLFADHLNRYASFAAYRNAKHNISRFQTKSDITFLPKGNKYNAFFKKYGKGSIHYFDTATAPTGQTKWQIHPVSIAGASAVAAYLGISRRTIQTQLRTFTPPSGRRQIVSTRRRVTYINDTTATNPGAAVDSIIAAGKKYARIVVIAGGEDKNFPKKDLRAFSRMLKNTLAVILLPGSCTNKLARFLNTQKHVSLAVSMKDAVRQAKTIARPGDAIILSPGAASFNLFANEFDRGNKFNKAIS